MKQERHVLRHNKLREHLAKSYDAYTDIAEELTNKCLGCDFGYGDDLSKPRLQQAVYEKLVCELDDMIRSLAIKA